MFNHFGAPFRPNYTPSCEESGSPRRGVHFSGLGVHFCQIGATRRISEQFRVCAPICASNCARRFARNSARRFGRIFRPNFDFQTFARNLRSIFCDRFVQFPRSLVYRSLRPKSSDKISVSRYLSFREKTSDASFSINWNRDLTPCCCCGVERFSAGT